MPPRRTRARYQNLYNYTVIGLLLSISVLCRALFLLPLIGPSRLHLAIGDFVKWTQTILLLQHASPSRIMMVWIVCVHEAPKTSVAYTIMILAWSLSEVAEGLARLFKVFRPLIMLKVVLDQLARVAELMEVALAMPEAGWKLGIVAGGHVPELWDWYQDTIRKRND